jgi:hypothetical protein
MTGAFMPRRIALAAAVVSEAVHKRARNVPSRQDQVAARLARSTSGVIDKDLDRKQMIDHVCADARHADQATTDARMAHQAA